MDDLLRARLESLNRDTLPEIKSAVLEAAKAVSRSAKAGAVPKLPDIPPAPHTETKATGKTPAAGLVRSGEVVETEFGPHLRVRLPLDDLWQGGAKLIAARQEFLQSELAAASVAVEPTLVMAAEFAAFVSAMPDRAIALDLETCGLAGSALFLVGLLRHVAGQPTVELLLARNYAEEAAVLSSLWNIMSEHDVLLTFNGKTFDWPMVIERSVRHRLPPPADRDRWLHIDILHHARRRWKNHLPNCRLQTLERHVCRRTRAADIPGHAIPGVYAEYVRTGFEREMDTVLYHNALDLVTLVDLAHRLAA